MFGAAELNDDLVVAAVNGQDDGGRVLELVSPQVRLMVTARLSPTPAQFHSVEEVSQIAMVALADGLGRLRNPTVNGLRAFMSGIVSRKVADHLKGRGEGDLTGPRPRSLDSTVAGMGGAHGDGRNAGPLWQFLSASGHSPGSDAARGELFERVMTELGRLKDEHREVITLAFFDQMPTRDIAQRMGLSRPAASMLLLRALKTLRRTITGSNREGDGRA